MYCITVFMICPKATCGHYLLVFSLCEFAHLQEKDLKDGRILEMISTFLATGELPILFSNDEEEGLLQVNGNAILNSSTVLTTRKLAVCVCVCACVCACVHACVSTHMHVCTFT